MKAPEPRPGLQPPNARARADTAPLGDRPVLTVVVDTEEEFDWSRPHARDNVAVTSIAAQHHAQSVCERYGVIPTYVIDYPVAADPEAVATLRRFADAGRAVIGTHLHPWVSPPHEEAVTVHNSYACNLPPPLERAKLETLTDTIARRFGARPVVYKAGRYGIGAATPTLLADLGYTVDLSVVSHTPLVDDGGPDFTAFTPDMFWLTDDRTVLEIPLSCGFSGLIAKLGPALYPYMQSRSGLRFHAPGAAARLRLLERSRLTPENVGLEELKRITRALVDQGYRVLQFAWHSPSLAPGYTPYVRDRADLEAFLAKLDGYFAFFMGELGGAAMTPTEIRSALAPT